MSRSGQLHRGRWEFAQARACLEEASRVYGEIGEEREVLQTGLALAELDREQDQLPEARTRLIQVVHRSQSLGAVRSECRALAGLAVVAAHQGHGAEARSFYRRGLTMAHKAGSVVSQAEIRLRWADEVLAPRGLLSQASEACRQAVTLFSQTGQARWVARALSRWAPVLLWCGDMAGARGRSRESLRLADRIQEPDLKAVNRVHLAWIGLEELSLRPGDEVRPVLEELAKSLAGAVGQLARGGTAAGEAMAWNLLSRTRLELGQLDDARAAHRRARDLYHRCLDRGQGLAARVTGARIVGAAATVEARMSARRQLLEILSEARARRLARVGWEAGLVLAEIELAGLEDRRAARRLRTLREAAHGRGVGLMLAQVDRLLSRCGSPGADPKRRRR